MNTSPTYFIYARKSTRGDEKQILSIGSQLAAIDKLVIQNNLKIAGVIREKESAHTPGRPIFNDMMRRIEAGEADGIIAWHPDRVARNSKDGGEIIYLLDIGKLVDLKFVTFWFENTPQGKSMLGHAFVESKQYSDKLSCDTQRGLLDKAEMGFYPSVAPLGYLNDKGNKTIVVDRQVAPIVKEAFETFAEGDKTLDFMRKFFAERGVLTKKRDKKRHKGNCLVHVDWVRRLLRNPFYYGHFKYAGGVYEGKHPPIISKALFDKVQEVIERRTHHMPEQRKPKAFTGLLRCGECGLSITASNIKNRWGTRYTYYHCTKKSKTHKCAQKYVREDELDRQLSDLLSRFILPENWGAGLLGMLEQERSDLTQSSREVVNAQQAELATVNTEYQRLQRVYIAGDIERDAFLHMKQDFLSRKKTIQEKIEESEDNPNAWLEPYRTWIETAENTGKIADSGSFSEKKAHAQKVFGSNLFLDSKKARGIALKPFSLLAEGERFPDMVPEEGIEPPTKGL